MQEFASDPQSPPMRSSHDLGRLVDDWLVKSKHPCTKSGREHCEKKGSKKLEKQSWNHEISGVDVTCGMSNGIGGSCNRAKVCFSQCLLTVQNLPQGVVWHPMAATYKLTSPSAFAPLPSYLEPRRVELPSQSASFWNETGGEKFAPIPISLISSSPLAEGREMTVMTFTKTCLVFVVPNSSSSFSYS